MCDSVTSLSCALCRRWQVFGGNLSVPKRAARQFWVWDALGARAFMGGAPWSALHELHLGARKLQQVTALQGDGLAADGVAVECRGLAALHVG